VILLISLLVFTKLARHIAGMDDLDTRLIAALRRNGRAGISDLAAELDVSRNTVRARMARLESRGDIIGYTAILKGDVNRMPVRGVMLIGIDGKGSEKVIARLTGCPK
jgi:DNA-binding Lrp family transcriptional regulator